MRRRKHETDTGLRDALGNGVRRQVERQAEHRQGICRTGFRRSRAVAVLGNGHAATSHDQHRRRRDIIGVRPVAARAHNVDGSVRRGNDLRLGAHYSGTGGQFRDRHAAHAQAHEECGHLRRRRLAGHDEFKRSGRLLRRKRFAVGDLGEISFEVAHASAVTPVISRKFRSMSWPCSVAMLSG